MGKTYFVDTNIFIRYLTNDNPEDAQQCLVLFQKARSSKINITASPEVIAEVVYVLSREPYTKDRNTIANYLKQLILLFNIPPQEKNMYLDGLKFFSSETVDYEDAMLVARTKAANEDTIYSYDNHFNRFDQITRLEP